MFYEDNLPPPSSPVGLCNTADNYDGIYRQKFEVPTFVWGLMAQPLPKLATGTVIRVVTD